MDKISGFWQRRRRDKLYQQWVEKDGLSVEDVPPDVMQGEKERRYRRSLGESGSSLEEVPDEVRGSARTRDAGRGMMLLPVKYVLMGGGLIVTLVVILAVILTVFIMQSC